MEMPRMPKRIREVHKSIRERLGYSQDESVKEVLADWKRRTTTVCKPCWELKYCPYGPLVEQLPLLPARRSETEAHIAYLSECLNTGFVGQIVPLDEETKAHLERVLADDELVRSMAIFEIQNELRFAAAADSDDPITDIFGGPLPPLQEYRMPFEVEGPPSTLSEDAPNEIRSRVEEEFARIRERARQSLQTGFEDHRKPLDPARKKMFERQVENFDPDEHPDDIPEIFEEASCNIFGHICPVFFAAEAITETSEARRRGRYIPFSVKMRVVRRDNHTCQECGIHLRDDEVEFDHKIPVSRGGSSEEHNIRLTCYDCNRDKSARIDI